MNRPSPDDMKAMGVIEYVQQLEEENKKLQEKVNTYSEEYGKLREENKKLKKELETVAGAYYDR